MVRPLDSLFPCRGGHQEEQPCHSHHLISPGRAGKGDQVSNPESLLTSGLSPVDPRRDLLVEN